MNKSEITCRCCQGTGKVAVPACLQVTLNMVRKRPGRPSMDYATAIISKENALMRLKRLHSLGLVMPDGRQGKANLWRAVG